MTSGAQSALTVGLLVKSQPRSPQPKRSFVAPAPDAHSNAPVDDICVVKNTGLVAPSITPSQPFSGAPPCGLRVITSSLP